jgi:hypothetical protein
MPWVEFEPKTSVFEGAKTVHASDRAATVIGPITRLHGVISQMMEFFMTTAVRTTNPTQN